MLDHVVQLHGGANVIFAIDAMTGFSLSEHEHVRTAIFPRIGRVRTTADILASREE